MIYPASFLKIDVVKTGVKKHTNSLEINGSVPVVATFKQQYVKKQVRGRRGKTE